MNRQPLILLSEGDNVAVATAAIAAGDAPILCETREIHGAEHLPRSRAVSEDVAAKLGAKIEYGYAERVTEHGLVFMDTPGYDPVSATGQVAGGANMIAFTTGRGSCFGSRPARSFKLPSNSALYHAMEEDMDIDDIDCGTIAMGEATISGKGREISS